MLTLLRPPHGVESESQELWPLCCPFAELFGDR